MNKNWDINHMRKIFQFGADTNAQKKSLIESLNKQEDTVFVENLKETLKTNYTEFLELFSEIYKHEKIDKNELSSFLEYVVENTKFQTKEEFLEELQYYTYFKEIISHINEYKNIYSMKEAIKMCDETLDQETSQQLIRFVIANYYLNEKANKADFIYRQDNIKGETIYNLMRSENRDLHLHKSILIKYNDEIKLEENKKKQKKIQKTIQKGYKKTNQLYKSNDLTNQQISEEIQHNKDDIIQKIKQIDPDKQLCIQELNHFIEECDQYCTNILQNNGCQTKNKNDIIESTECNEEDLKVIESFYQQHHLYFKKTQIIDELIHYPAISSFYHFYNQAVASEDDEEYIKLLEELIGDIQESGLKNKESLRRLSTESQKEIDRLIAKNIDEVEEDIPVFQKEIHDDIIQIGKFEVLKNSALDNPVDLNKITLLLSKGSQTKQDELKSLVYQIGYDKVHAYLLKNPGLSIEDLTTIIFLDRSLRFEYQRILEDIEMYFRSSFTFYLTNKYDKKLLIPQTQSYFYKRGYLMRELFEDSQVHYEQVHQLRDRIDMEIKNNNLQVAGEYNRYKYALPFSTAAGIMHFGWNISVFENLNYQDKIEYLHEYFQELSVQTFCNWLKSLANLRNKCAHYHSFYRLSSLKELHPIMTKNQDANGFDDDFKHSSLFYYTLVMTRISPNTYNIEDFIDGLGVIFRKAERNNSVFDLQNDYSFPKNWRTILENEKCKKMKQIK